MAKILVIEVNAANMKLACLLLRNAGHAVLCAVDAETGMTLARTDQPELILMDIQLPGMDGLTATGLLRQDPVTAAIPVIALTAMAMKADQEKARWPTVTAILPNLCAIRRFTWLQTLLHAQGYHTVCANNGEHALACVANDPPDLILLDVKMPGVNSYQVAQTLKADPDTVSIPIILITALTNRNARIDGLQTGAEDFLTKPVDRDELWLRMRNLLRLKAFASLRNHARVLEEQIELRTSQLQTANKELQAFSYSVAHDLRTPLRAISGLADMLQKELGTSAATERSLHCITPIRAGTLQMNRLIDALLSLAQLSQMVINWETVDLSALAHTILEGYQEREPGRVVQLDIQPNLAAQGDPHLLRNVLENLFSNAWKYSSHKPQALIAFSQESGPDGVLTYAVKDNGAGFGMDYSNKLFGTFQRLHTQAEFNGIGIGLATTLKIITCHGGRIWAESTLGQGATFYFTLGKPSN